METQKYEIIIAEDDEVLRDLYLRKFASTEYSLRTAANGEEALRMIAEKKPDLMLLDINMPIIDGFGVLSKIPPEQRTFPVIMLTNFDDQQNRDRGAQFNIANYFVKKDMTIKSLVGMVEAQLKAKQG